MKQLVTAVAAVMRDVGAVRATGVNSYDKYTYTTDKDLLEKLQPAMVEHGLVLMPVSIDVDRDIVDGKNKHRATVKCVYALCHTSGERIDLQIVGEGSDRGDKAVYKALTGAYKYLLRQSFAIPTGDDVESDAPTVDEVRELIRERMGQGVSQETVAGALESKVHVSKVAEMNERQRATAWRVVWSLKPERGVDDGK